jgi:Flp pilus assembly protein CpaB
MPRFRRPRSPVHTARQVAAALLTLLALVLALRPAAAPAAGGGDESVPVAVAARDLPAGTVLTAADLTTARYPADVAPAGVSGEPKQLRGRVLAGSVRAREPITDARLVGPGIVSLLAEGQVAAPVRLADLAVAALVHTGDRVDVLATPATSSGSDAPAAAVVAEGALVVAATGADEQAGAGLLLLAVDDETAARLAAAATTATLTVTLPRP